jgi:hypothetical protein
VFNETVQTLPWDDRLREAGKGPGGNFDAWSVTKVPTLYLLDDWGLVRGPYFRMEDVENKLPNLNDEVKDSPPAINKDKPAVMKEE